MKGESLMILLVEDNEDHAEMVKRSLRANHVANPVLHVTDGEAALDYLFRRGKYTDSKKSPRPHLILLDLRLPKIDGLDVLKEIKESEELRRIPVVVLTSSEEENDVAMVYDHYANSYLSKPLDFKKFTELMRELGFYWLGWNVNPFVQDTAG